MAINVITIYFVSDLDTACAELTRVDADALAIALRLKALADPPVRIEIVSYLFNLSAGEEISGELAATPRGGRCVPRLKRPMPVIACHVPAAALGSGMRCGVIGVAGVGHQARPWRRAGGRWRRVGAPVGVGGISGAITAVVASETACFGAGVSPAWHALASGNQAPGCLGFIHRSAP